MIQEIELTDTLQNKIYGELQPFTPEGYACFIAWCTANNVFYYAKGKTGFSIAEGYELAELAGCKFIILDNMS